ncbi:DUF2306 domain-containing protein [Coralliovum pocilloporae]|uniref:DUF2306 domain-containing protein n=1 Tax=Coralliovum pocilloporae TaxID=3066369 RepID=UPI003306B55E
MMTIAPLLTASLPVQIHLLSAVAALLLTIILLSGRKGTEVHRWLGRLWIALMAIVALSSFLIFEIRLLGPFSPIHILSVITLAGLIGGWTMARRGNVRRHARIMKSLVFGGLMLAGLFTLVPGRLMYAMVFGG